jgi:hypothetical protein
MDARLSPKIISGSVMPSFFAMASMGAALRMGSLHVDMRKPCWTMDFSSPSAAEFEAILRELFGVAATI